MNKVLLERVVLVNLTILLFLFLAASNSIQQTNAEHFSWLAQSFLKGELFFVQQLPSWGDTTFSQGRYYWPLGPFPAVLLMPFVAAAQVLGVPSQGGVQFMLALGVFGLCYMLARRQGYAPWDSWYWAFAFVFASAFLGSVFFPASWYFAHVVGAALMALTLVEYLGKKRHWLMGFLWGLVAATRATAGVGILFFILDAVFAQGVTRREKVRRLSHLLFPFVMILGLLGLYNYARFGSVFEQGYATQISLDYSLRRARSYGLISLQHLPQNLYYAFLSGPLPVFRDAVSHVLAFPFVRSNPHGMSIFLSSPYLVLLFMARYKDTISKLLLATSVSIAIPIFLYYGGGYIQYVGYRYALDFLPFLFLLVMRDYRSGHAALSTGMKTVIVFSAVFNQYLLLATLYART